MSSLRTSNPAFAGTIFGDWEQSERRSSVMTVQGTAGKAIALLVILVACAAVIWNYLQTQRVQALSLPEQDVAEALSHLRGLTGGIMMGSAIGGLVLAFITIFKKSWSPLTAPVYSACEGVFLGSFSGLMNGFYPGIVGQAVALTFLTAGCMLFVYVTGLIRVTGRLYAAVTAGTSALCLFYFGSILLSFFGLNGGVNLMRGSSVLGIGISVIAVGLAAFNLLLDFDFIDKGARSEAPKFMEWYGAFGLMVTLVWLYLEILRLLAKLQDRR